MKKEFVKDGINYIVGDLIRLAQEGEFSIIAHQANCYRLMGAGVAAHIAREFPSAMLADFMDERTKEDRLGDFSMATHGGLTVYNLYGQMLPGPNTDTRALHMALLAMRNDILNRNVHDIRIGVPMLGCGIGGGNWAVISKIIVRVFEPFDWSVCILEKDLKKVLG